MEENKTRAWDLLEDKEKSALQLVFGHGKSNMEASVIMNIYPYKFNEILLRAKKFFLTFSEFFNLYDSFNVSTIADPVGEYLDLTIIKRYSPTDAVSIMDNLEFFDYNTRAHLLASNMGSLKISHNYLHDTVKTFDMWNRFRILPKTLQVPSPFNRRQNKAYKRIFNKITETSELSFRAIQKAFEVKYPPYNYAVFMGEYHLDSYYILKFHPTEVNLRYFSDNLIPVFNSDKVAKEFTDLCLDFYFIKNKSVHLARAFWPEFRKLITGASNFESLLNLKDFDASLSTVINNKDIIHLYKGPK